MSDAKAHLLASIRAAAKQNTVSEREVIRAFRDGAGDDGLPFYHKLNFASVLTGLGGLVVMTGIIVLITQNWDLLNTMARILVTLGSGIVAYTMGGAFHRRTDFPMVEHVAFVLSCFLIPVGLHVAFHEYGFDLGSAATQTMISILMTGLFAVSLFVFRSALFVLFLTLSATWFYFSLTNHLFPQSSVYYWQDFAEYRAMVASISWALLGYSLSPTHMDKIRRGLTIIGLAGFFTSALALSGYEPNQNVMWELLYPLLTFGCIFLGVQIRQTTYVTIGSIAFMAYILKITAEYFSSQFGWPLALVVAGLLLIATGYATYTINKRFVKKA